MEKNKPQESAVPNEGETIAIIAYITKRKLEIKTD